jgi:hypothetical protein
MTLYEKVMAIYPQITNREMLECIRFQNDSDGKGDYIAKWNHPTYPKPTDAQLAEIN